MEDNLSRRLHDQFAAACERFGAASLARVETFLRVLTGEQPWRTPDPLQAPELYFFPGLTSRPWHDDPPAWLARLEESAPEIRREMEGVRRVPESFQPYVHGPEAAYRHEKFLLEHQSRRWTVYDLNLPAAEQECPTTTALLGELFRPHLGEPVTSQFSALEPGSRIPSHCGVANFFLTAHLGLITPEGSLLRVGSESRGWTAGRAFVFDDSYEHAVRNEGTQTRIVLIARFWHPELTEAEIEAVGSLHEVVIDAAGGSVDAQREMLRRLRGA
jgi:aspartate beta-hydroxylase